MSCERGDKGKMRGWKMDSKKLRGERVDNYLLFGKRTKEGIFFLLFWLNRNII